MKKLLLACCLLPSLALAEPPAPPMPPRMVSVSGEATEQVAPDQAILNITLQQKNQALDKAKAENDRMTEKLVNITREFKVPTEKIALSNLNISPEYIYPPSGKRQFSGYVVSRSLRVTIDDLSIHERLLSAIVDSGVDQVNGIEFTLAKPAERGNGLRVKAFENARSKAEALATAAGAKLGKALQISNGTSGIIAPPMPMNAMRMMAADASEKSVAPSLPGMLTLQENVSVTFAME
jgi:uncharacterized protein